MVATREVAFCLLISLLLNVAMHTRVHTHTRTLNVIAFARFVNSGLFCA